MQILVGLGANLGDRSRTLELAIAAMRQKIGSVTAQSRLYETEALVLPGATGSSPAFLNAVVVLESELAPEEILLRLQRIEADLGRVRGERWAARTLDLDLLGAGNVALQSASLTLPHPELAKRDFVLVPLAEAAPYWKHPLLGKTPLELYQELLARGEKLFVRGVFQGP